MKIEHAKYFVSAVSLANLMGGVYLRTKIILRKILIGEIFGRQKYPDLRYSKLVIGLIIKHAS